LYQPYGHFVGAGAGFEPTTFRVAVPKMSCDTHKGCHDILTAAPFLPPFIRHRRRSAKNKLFARRRAQIPGAWRLLQNSDICMQQKIPRSKDQGIFLGAGAGFEPTTSGL